MKKFGKFLFGTLSLAAAAGGVYCLYKNRINKDTDFDDFDEEDEEDEDLNVSAEPEDREYVSITISSEDAAQNGAEEDAPESTEAEAEPAAAEEAPDEAEASDEDEPAQTAFVQTETTDAQA